MIFIEYSLQNVTLKCDHINQLIVGWQDAEIVWIFTQKAILNIIGEIDFFTLVILTHEKRYFGPF